jgi:cell division protein ZapA (FtsZ GTPase activity inhibitor)
MKDENKEHHQKVEITINGKKYHVRGGNTAVEELRHLADVPHAEILCQLHDGKYTDLEEKAHIEIRGCEVFAGHFTEHHLVEITINGKKHETRAGNNSVEHLRHLGRVPDDEILSQFKAGKYVDLDNKAHVEIHGCEIFASHIKSGGSS